MKAEIVRFSNALFELASPPITVDVLLKADGLPQDVHVVHIMHCSDYWEALLTSESFEDKSIERLYKEPSRVLFFNPQTIAELRAEHAKS